MSMRRETIMARTSVAKRPRKSASASPLMVRLDTESKAIRGRAAKLRKVSVSDYVREVTLAQARREVHAAAEATIVLTAEEQLAFWKALHEPARLTEAQRRLGKLMRGES